MPIQHPEPPLPSLAVCRAAEFTTAQPSSHGHGIFDDAMRSAYFSAVNDLKANLDQLDSDLSRGSGLSGLDDGPNGGYGADFNDGSFSDIAARWSASPAFYADASDTE